MKTVFSNDMVAHVWAQQNQESGRSNNGNFYFEGDTIYSYGRHFPIARIVSGLDKVALITTESYSVTTSQHINDTQRAINHYKKFSVETIDTTEWNAKTDSKVESKRIHKANHDAMKKAFMLKIDELARAKNIYHNPLNDMADSAFEYSKLFKLARKRWNVPQDSDLIARAMVLRAESAKRGAKTRKVKAQARKTYAKEIQAWRNGYGYEYEYPGRYPEGLTATPADKKARDKSIWHKRAKFDYWQGHCGWSVRDAVNQHATRFDTMLFNAANAQKITDYLNGVADSLPHGVELTDSQRSQRAASVAPIVELWASGTIDRMPNGGIASEEQRTRRYGAIIERWRNGERVSIPSDAGTLMRVNGDIVETSQGARFPVTDALRAFPLIKRCKDKSTVWQRNGQTISLGNFHIDRIDDSGNVRAGCHFVLWAEVERVALELGVG